MDPKITLLFLLIGSVIGLSYLSDEKRGRFRRQLSAMRVALFCARTAQGLGTGSATPAKLSAFFPGAKCLRRLQLARRAHH